MGRYLLIFAAVAAATVLSGQAPDSGGGESKPATKAGTGAASVPVGGSEPITEARRTKLREMERDYWQAMAKMRELERDYENLRLRSVGLDREIRAEYQRLEASCGEGREFDAEKLDCAPKRPQKPPDGAPKR